MTTQEKMNSQGYYRASQLEKDGKTLTVTSLHTLKNGGKLSASSVRVDVVKQTYFYWKYTDLIQVAEYANTKIKSKYAPNV